MKPLVITGAALLVLLAAMPLLRHIAEPYIEAARLSRSLSRTRRSGL